MRLSLAVLAALLLACGSSGDPSGRSYRGVVIDSLQGHPRAVFVVYYGDSLAPDSLVPDNAGSFTIPDPPEPLWLSVGSIYPYFPFARQYARVPGKVDTLRLRRSDPYVRNVSTDNQGIVHATIVTLRGANQIDKHNTSVAINSNITTPGDFPAWTWQQAGPYEWSVAIDGPPPPILTVIFTVYDSAVRIGTFSCPNGTSPCTGE
ncbi:MAG: hypothetical protein IPK12_23295 [Gemmatimonadetes bacterium]|nr:hypothetical protein [Gemmatimonadota bacterium]